MTIRHKNEFETAKTIRAYIKKRLKVEKITYSQLAKRLSVSEVTVKRWLSKSDISIRQLNKIGEILDFSIFEQLEDPTAKGGILSKYSPAQEQFFARHPESFLVFIKIAFGYSFDQIREQLGISEKTFRSHLRDFERLKLLELWPRDQIKIKLRGPYKIPTGGPMKKKFDPAIIKVVMSYFLNKYEFRIDDPASSNGTLFRPTELYLTQNSRLAFANEMNRLLLKYAEISSIEAANKEKIMPTSIILAIDVFDAWLSVLR